MKTKTLYIGLVALFQFPLAYGGQETHGGNAIVCSGKTGEKYDFYDYYITRQNQTRDFQVDLGPPGTDLEHVEYVLNRLEKIDSVAADRFRERAHLFLKEMKLKTPEEMKIVADTAENLNPEKGCEKEQFAVQVFNLLPGQARYFVNEKLWKEVGEKIRAGLILHEVILRDAVEIFHQYTSEKASYYTAMISSADMNQMTPETYAAIVSASFGSSYIQPICSFSFPKYGFQVCIAGETRSYDNTYAIRVASGTIQTDQGQVLTPSGNELSIIVDGNGNLKRSLGFSGNVISNGQVVSLKNSIVFSKNHHVDNAQVEYGQTYKRFGLNLDFENSGVTFDENYDVISNLDSRQAQNIVLPAGTFPLTDAHQQIAFHPNGMVKSFYAYQNTLVKVAGQDLDIRGPVSVFQNGQLSKVYAVDEAQNVRIQDNPMEIETLRFSDAGKIIGGEAKGCSAAKIGGLTILISKDFTLDDSENIIGLNEICKGEQIKIGPNLVQWIQPFGHAQHWAFYKSGKVALGDSPDLYKDFHPIVSPNCLAAGLSAEPTYERVNGRDQAFYDQDGRVCYPTKGYFESTNQNNLEKTLSLLNP